MKTVLKLLREELREWKQALAVEKVYHRGYEHDKAAKRSFKQCEKHIAELKAAIEKLK